MSSSLSDISELRNHPHFPCSIHLSRLFSANSIPLFLIIVLHHRRPESRNEDRGAVILPHCFACLLRIQVIASFLSLNFLNILFISYPIFFYSLLDLRFLEPEAKDQDLESLHRQYHLNSTTEESTKIKAPQSNVDFDCPVRTRSKKNQSQDDRLLF